MCHLTQDLPALSTVRRSSIRRRAALRRATRPTPRTRTTIARCCIATICAAVLSAIHCWTLSAAEIHAVGASAALQFLDDACELLLELVDAQDDDLVGVDAADCLDVVEEAGWNCGVVEVLVWVGEAAVEVDAFVVLEPEVSVSDVSRSSQDMSLTYHSFSGSSSCQ
jgi:hypothetical protein